MLAPFLEAVRLLVLQIWRPLAASRQTRSPHPLAVKINSPRSQGLEVLLNTRFDGVRISGQRKRAAGGSAATSTISPLTSKRLAWKTGVAAESLLLVTMGSRQ